jgi:hypothetical protein
MRKRCNNELFGKGTAFSTLGAASPGLEAVDRGSRPLGGAIRRATGGH